MLWGIRPEILARLQFPVGDYQKEEIRQIADRLGLHHVAEKPDSQEICFVPDQDHARFIRQNRPPQDTSGAIVTTDGRVVGRHEGVEKFTIGQRKGLGVAFGEPRYVVRIDSQSREVVVGTKDELARHELSARGANWFFPPAAAFRVPGEDSLPQPGGRGHRGDLAGRSIPCGIPGALLRSRTRTGSGLLSGRRALGRGLDRLSPQFFLKKQRQASCSAFICRAFQIRRCKRLHILALRLCFVSGVGLKRNVALPVPGDAVRRIPTAKFGNPQNNPH